jgi:hypothetical protein
MIIFDHRRRLVPCLQIDGRCVQIRGKREGTHDGQQQGLHSSVGRPFLKLVCAKGKDTFQENEVTHPLGWVLTGEMKK